MRQQRCRRRETVRKGQLNGFNSRGRSNVCLYKVKEFGTGAGLGWQSRLCQLEPAGFTRMGAAVRHAISLLTQRSGAKREILLVLSDGIPYDEGYEGTYALGDTKRALADAREAGVGCLCLSLGGQKTKMELEAVFGTASFARADHIAAIGPDLNELFNHALVAAERANRGRDRYRVKSPAGQRNRERINEHCAVASASGVTAT